MASSAGVSSATEIYDVVIIGAGPVGLLLAVCLARWGYKIKQVDNRERPTLTGRADGIQPRSLHLLRNMGLKRQIMAHGPAKSYEVAFWDPSPTKEGIIRTNNLPSCPESIGARYPFSVLLHQGFIEQVFIEDLRKNKVSVQRPWTITGFKNDGQDPTYPVEINLQHVQTEETETVRAKYLFSGEGARSFVRERLGVKVHHKDPIAHVWGVIDGVVRSDFPDIKMKCTIHSDHGSIMTIPRENNLVRLYVQIASSTDQDWNPRKQVSQLEVQQSAKKILQPYFIEWDRVEWYSVYPIKQGLVEKYTIDHRIFLGGDCCHTHSPKAGQGMNTAFHDALNLAWKIHHVEAGFARRSILSTYESERKLIAENLLDFDAKYAALFSERNLSHGQGTVFQDGQEEANAFVEMFKTSSEFASGYGVAYGPNDLNWSPSHLARSQLFIPNGSKICTGRVMPAADVTRVIDANKVHLEQVVPLNGCFRIFVFAGDPSLSKLSIADFAANLQKKQSFYSVFKRPDLANVSYHERHNPHSMFITICTIFAAPRADINVANMLPPLLVHYRYHIYADDIQDPKFPETKAPAHMKLGIDERLGGVLVVRPDGHVGCVVGLIEGSGTMDALNEYFGTFSSKVIGAKKVKAVL